MSGAAALLQDTGGAGVLYVWTGRGPRLLGDRCTGCGVTRLAASGRRCRSCGGDVGTVTLAASGVVESWTDTGEVRLAEVRLDDGVLVLGRVAEEQVAVGDRVHLTGDAGSVAFRT